MPNNGLKLKPFVDWPGPAYHRIGNSGRRSRHSWTLEPAEAQPCFASAIESHHGTLVILSRTLPGDAKISAIFLITYVFLYSYNLLTLLAPCSEASVGWPAPLYWWVVVNLNTGEKRLTDTVTVATAPPCWHVS